MRDALVILAGYLLGSIPFAYLITKATAGSDIRLEGDGNVGTRNVMHVAGRLPGLCTLVLDMAKGALACEFGRQWSSGPVPFYLTGFALMVGHGFPVWLRWRGGKGLAAMGGFILRIWPYSTLVALAVLLLARRLVAHFDAAVAVASVAMLVASYFEGNDLTGLMFIVSLLLLAGAKRLIDLPYERAVRSGEVSDRVLEHSPEGGPRRTG
jgi:glycerol-3-phosphate acyltransferase PlsY